MPCVETHLWSALAEKRLPAADEALVIEHAATCAACAEKLAVAQQKRLLSNDAETQALSSTQKPPTVEPAPVLARGSVIGRFVVLETLGMGGMGAVYSAYDPNLDRRVAVKTLHVTTSTDPTAHGRMLREAQAMARLNHPNVVNIFEVGEHHGAIFIAMELVPGVTLRSWERARTRSWQEVVSVFAQAGRGLAAAHAAHLVHRDFKPANVLIGDDGRVRVTDFGVARADGSLEPVGALPQAAADDSGRSGSLSEPLTRGDVVVGTIGYMSPEQTSGKVPLAQSDQFSFCICLWEALYGQRPFTGASVAEVSFALLKGPPPVRPRDSDVPTWLHAVVMRGLSREPDQRYPTMEALLADLEGPRDEWKKRAAVWGALAAVALALVATPLVLRSRQESKCAATARELDGVWDDGARDAVSMAFGRVGKPFTAAALASARRALDGYARDFLDTSAQACNQALVRAELSPNDYALESACLAQRKRELTALVSVLSAADDAVVERAGTISWGLSPVRTCTQLTRLRADPRLVLGAQDEKVSALQTSLARARPLVDAGKLAEAAPLIEQAITASRELNRRALEAEALALQASMQQAGAKYAEASDSWTKAAMAAQASGFDELLALAAVRQTTVVGFQLNKPADGRLWDALAKATIERMGGDDVLSLERITAVARLGNAEGKPLEVVQQHTDALALAKTVLGVDHPLLWKVEFDLGSSLVGAKDSRGAVPHLERALQLREKEVSADHPEVAMVQSTLANAYFFLGRAKESEAAFTRALLTRETLFGKESPRLIVTLNNFGDTFAKSGRLDEAAAMVTRAQAIAKKSYPPAHPYVQATTLTYSELLLAKGELAGATNEVNAVLSLQPPPSAPYLAEAGAVMAFIALKQGKPKDALVHARGAVAAGEQVGARSAELVLPLLARGEAELALGDVAAVKTFERALSLVDETRPWPVYSADARFGLARARRSAGASVADVRAVAEEALELYRAAAGQDTRVLQVQAFLARP